MRRSPLSSLVIVLTLALGIGANTAIFSIARAVLLEPLPYPDPGRVVAILASNPEAGLPRFTLSAPDFRDFRDRSTAFEAMGAVATTRLHLTGGGEAERLFGVRATAGFFEVLGRPALLGRLIQPADDRPGAPRVVVLSYGLWQRRFGGREDVQGELVTLSGEPYEVVGVAPRDYYPLQRDFFVAAALDYDALSRGFHDLVGFGRLSDGTTLERARADLASIAAGLADAYPDTNTGWGVMVQRWQDLIVEPVRPALLTLLGAVVLVLLIAGANAVNLMLARLAAREREIALRAALGAGRRRLVRLFLTESVLLTLLGGVLGVLLARSAVRVLLALYGEALPHGQRVAIDGTVLLYALGLSLVVGMLFGLAPALRASRPDLRSALAGGGSGHTGRGGRWLRGGLVLAEVALSFVLLIGAGLLVRSFARLARVEPGFDPRGALSGRLELPDRSYGDPARRIAFYRQLFDRLAALPGIDGWAAISDPPLQPGLVYSFRVEGRPPPPPGRESFAHFRAVSPGYLGAMGIPLRAGREFTPGDDEGAVRVAVVSAAAVRRFWPGEDPRGQLVDVEYHEGEEPIWWTVVGVAGDVHQYDLTRPPEPQIYVPLLQYPSATATLVARSAAAPETLAGPLRRTVAGLDQTLPLFEVGTLEAELVASTARPRFNAALLATFAGLALVLAAIGVYGVVGYGVGLRRRELAVRRAFGAGRRRLLGLVVRQGMTPVAAGIAAGVVGALLTNRLLAGLLYGVGTGDPVSWLGVTALLLAVGAAACWLPARRAVSLNPWSVLREE